MDSFTDNKRWEMGSAEPQDSHPDVTVSDPSVLSSSTLSVDYRPEAKSHLPIPPTVRTWLQSALGDTAKTQHLPHKQVPDRVQALLPEFSHAASSPFALPELSSGEKH